MNLIYVKDFPYDTDPEYYCLDLSLEGPKACCGCWSCWWKTPGRCIHLDLDRFYREYINAETVILYIAPSRDFVSSRLKRLFDRMIPLFLPYTSFSSGESMHVPRYQDYPDIQIRYRNSFQDSNGEKIFRHYIHRVFYQFHSKKIDIGEINE